MNLYGDYVLVIAHLTALLDHSNSLLRVAPIVLKTLVIHTGIYSLFHSTLVPTTIKLKYVRVIKKS